MPNTARQGDWIETYTGRQFFPMDPRPEDVDIQDIAHALSQICRFNGHTRHHYSVAQHSVYCAELAQHRVPADSVFVLHALLHDAAEAYVCDIPRPLKPDLAGYAAIEARVQEAVYARFGIDPPGPHAHSFVKAIDNEVLYSEARQLLFRAAWVPQGQPQRKIDIEEITPRTAEAVFLKLFDRLMDVRRN